MFKFFKKKWVQVFLYFCFLAYIFPDVNNFFLFLFFLGAALIYFPSFCKSFCKSLFSKFYNLIKNVFKTKQSSTTEKTAFEFSRERQAEIMKRRESAEKEMHGTLYALEEGGFGSTEYGKSAWKDFEIKLVDTLEKAFKKIIDGKYLDVYKWDTNNKTVFISGSDKFIFKITPIASNENTSIWGQLPWQTRQDGIYIEVQRPKDASKNPTKALRSMFEAAVDQIKSRTNVYIRRQCFLRPLILPGSIMSGHSGFIPCKENIIENETSFFCSISLISNDIFKKNEANELDEVFKFIDPPEGKELDEIGFDFNVTSELSYLAHLSGEASIGNPSLFGHIPIPVSTPGKKDEEKEKRKTSSNVSGMNIKELILKSMEGTLQAFINKPPKEAYMGTSGHFTWYINLYDSDGNRLSEKTGDEFAVECSISLLEDAIMDDFNTYIKEVEEDVRHSFEVYLDSCNDPILKESSDLIDLEESNLYVCVFEVVDDGADVWKYYMVNHRFSDTI